MSCTTPKKAIQNLHTISDLSHDYNATTRVSENSVVKSTSSAMNQKHLSVELQTTLTSNDEVTTIIREYDTSKDIDPKTGKPPLLKETTQTRNKTDTSNQQLNASQTEKSEMDALEHADINKDVQSADHNSFQKHDDKQSDTTTIRGQTRLQTFLCTLGVIVLLAVAGWGYLKIKKRL